MKTILSLLIALGLLTNATAVQAAEAGPDGAPAKPAAPESFQIRNKKFGDLLRPEDANSANGTRLVLYSAQPWKCMTWKLHPAGEATFHAQNHFTSKTFVAAPQTGTAPAAVVQAPFAKDAKERPAWRFTKLPDGLYQIIEVKSGQALTATADAGGSARIVVGPPGQGDEQKWELIKTDPSKLTM